MSKVALMASTAAAIWMFADAAVAQTGESFLEEVVVTSQRREEKLQDVPASITTLNAGAIAQKGIQTTEELTLAVPGLLWGRSTNFSQPTIRGVGSRNAGTGDEPNVASYLDGVYQPDQTGTIFELTNIERIEVLKGPQGTLFGRNATGGAINIITPKPSFTPKGEVTASFGEFGYRKGGAYLTGPLFGDMAAASISAVAYGDDGYVRNVYLGGKQGKTSGVAIRPKTLFQATDDLQLQLNGLYSRSRNNVLLSLYSYEGNNAVRPVATRPALNPTNIPLNQLLTDRPYETAGAFVPTAQVEKFLIDGHLDYDFGWASLNGVLATGATYTKNNSLTEASPLMLSGNNYRMKNHYSVTEWVLTSPAEGALTWIAGAQGYLSRARTAPLISYTRNTTTTGATTVSRSISHTDTKAAAAFAELTWQAVPRLFLTGGLRYNWDRKESLSQANTAAAVRGKATFTDLSPRAVIRYEFAENANVYASYTEGFKAGIFNQTNAAQPVDPETIRAYEVGVKADIAGRVRVSAAAYHYDYKDLQVSTIVIVNGGSQSNTQNAGKVKIDGLEGAASVFVTENLTLDATVSVLKTKIRDFPNAVVQVPIGGASGNRTVSADVTGNELIRAPDHTFSLGATYRRPLAGGTLILNASAFFSDSYWVDLGNRLKQPSYEVVNASATWRSDQGYYVTVFGQNLTDQVYAVGWLVSNFTDATQAAKPRWYGVTVGYEF